MPTLKPLARDSKQAGSDSFGRALESKLGNKPDNGNKPGQLEQRSAGPKPKQKLSVDSPPQQKLASRPDDTQRAKAKESEDADPQTKMAEQAKPETGQKKGTVKANDRDKAIKKFMDSFESEFEIPSTRLVEAIANLDEKDQVKTPEETADAVINQLGLDEGDADRARAMYSSLLVDLSKAQPQQMSQSKMMAEASVPSFSEGVKQRSADAVSKRNLMNAGIDRMNQSFWAKPSAQDGMGPTNAMAPQSQALSRMMMEERPEGMEMMRPEVDEESLKAVDQAPRGDTGKIELPPHLRGQLEGNLTPALAAALAAKQAQMQAAASGNGQAAPANEQAAAGDEGSDADDGSISSTGGKPSFESAGLGKAGTSVGAGLGAIAGGLSKQSDSESSHSNSKQDSQDSFAKAMSHQKTNVKSGEKLTEKADFKNALQNPSTDALNAQGLPAKAEMHTGATAATVAGGAAMAPTSAEHDANVRQLMNQAQYLVKKGGGEVKVEMTPEGMGPVQLRVMVQDGKVHVQMNAQTAEAKKVIESGLAELKTSLAAHKLSVDHIKVDVVNGTNNDTAANNQQNLNNGNMQQREGTRQFWNQFNENFGSPQDQRSNFSDINDLKGYAQKRDPLQAMDSVSAKTRTLEGRGSGVNVVA